MIGHFIQREPLGRPEVLWYSTATKHDGTIGIPYIFNSCKNQICFGNQQDFFRYTLFRVTYFKNEMAKEYFDEKLHFYHGIYKTALARHSI